MDTKQVIEQLKGINGFERRNMVDELRNLIADLTKAVDVILYEPEKTPQIHQNDASKVAEMYAAKERILARMNIIAALEQK